MSTNNVISFGNTILADSGKRGILKPLDNNYYLLNAGGFNIPNRGGITYAFNDYLRECMGEDSDLNRRINEGQTYAELGHPPQHYLEKINGQVVRTKITDVFEWIHRLRTIDDNRVCGHIRKIHWIKTGGDRDPIYNQIEITPYGIFKDVLQDALDNPDINAAVSIRTVTKPQKFGDRVRQVDYFSTYDVVLEQGMLNACKHRTAGLEDLFSSMEDDIQDASITIEFDEVVSILESKLNNEVYQMRYSGNESFAGLHSMLDELKKRNAPKKVTVLRPNSLSAFF